MQRLDPTQPALRSRRGDLRNPRAELPKSKPTDRDFSFHTRLDLGSLERKPLTNTRVQQAGVYVELSE